MASMGQALKTSGKRNIKDVVKSFNKLCGERLPLES